MINIDEIKKELYKPSPNSHKGENGRLLVIGGSKLFHASIFWSADMASKIVDLVHFSSPAEENNELVRVKLKEGFWNGIVVPFDRIEEYIKEDDCVLIGPGMPRGEGLYEGETSTGEIVNSLVKKFPNKKWVIDGGALQEINVDLLNENMVITPHHKEWEALIQKDEEILQLPEISHYFRRVQDDKLDLSSLSSLSNNKMLKIVQLFSKRHNKVTVLLKGREDVVCRGGEAVVVGGGSSGMTKGGTGDVLAGIVAAFYCKNDAYLSAKLSSYVMKKSGEKLEKKMGEYFNASDLISVVPEILGNL